MSKYLCKINYVGDLAKGLLQEGGTRRRAEADRAFASVGGTIESMYYAFGEYDIYCIAELPDPESAASLLMIVRASGFDCQIVPLLTVEQMDKAAKKSPVYQPPGQ